MEYTFTTDNFETEVLGSDVPVLVDFWATWCGPCQMVLPIIEELAGEVKDAKICKVNVDEQPELAERFGVETIPTLLVFRNGQAGEPLIAPGSKAQIVEWAGL